MAVSQLREVYLAYGLRKQGMQHVSVLSGTTQQTRVHRALNCFQKNMALSASI